RRLHKTGSLYDARRQECLYRPRSPTASLIGLVAQLLPGQAAAALIGQVAYLLPGQVADFGPEPAPSETSVAHAERRPLRFGDHPMQPAFDQGTQGHSLSGRQFAGLAQQRVGNFYRRFHYAHPYGWPYMGTHIVLSASKASDCGPSSNPLFDDRWCRRANLNRPRAFAIVARFAKEKGNARGEPSGGAGVGVGNGYRLDRRPTRVRDAE